jgi:hypothetical protein
MKRALFASPAAAAYVSFAGRTIKIWLLGKLGANSPPFGIAQPIGCAQHSSFSLVRQDIQQFGGGILACHARKASVSSCTVV